MQKTNVYQFPKRGRFLPTRHLALTPERKAKGQQCLAKLRELIEEGRHE